MFVTLTDVTEQQTPSRQPRFASRRNVVVLGGAAAAVAAFSTGWLLLDGRPRTIRELLAERPSTIAHRGSDRDWPEMTGRAYAGSTAAGARALEISVGRTSDGVWFGLHDRSLDRTSGTVGLLAAEHTWAEVRRLRVTAALTRFPGQTDRPYLRLDDFLRRFVPDSVAFIDPKGVSADHYPELLELVHRLVTDSPDRIISRSDASNVRWAQLARAAGLHTWGFYYGRDLARRPSLLDTTRAQWDLLGLDWSATPQKWRQVVAIGKPVVGHVISTEPQRRLALQRGAAGVMVSYLIGVAP